MLTYAATSVPPQELAPSLSLLSFKPSKTAAFSLCSNLTVRGGGGGGESRASKWIDFYALRENKNGFFGQVVVSAVAAGAEATTEDVEETDGGSAVSNATATVATKPKKGKAALPLKRDRVWIFVFVGFLCEL